VCDVVRRLTLQTIGKKRLFRLDVVAQLCSGMSFDNLPSDFHSQRTIKSTRYSGTCSRRVGLQSVHMSAIVVWWLFSYFDDIAITSTLWIWFVQRCLTANNKLTTTLAHAHHFIESVFLKGVPVAHAALETGFNNIV